MDLYDAFSDQAYRLLMPINQNLEKWQTALTPFAEILEFAKIWCQNTQPNKTDIFYFNKFPDTMRFFTFFVATLHLKSPTN